MATAAATSGLLVGGDARAMRGRAATQLHDIVVRRPCAGNDLQLRGPGDATGAL